MKFLYPENVIFGIILFILLIINKKTTFTHLEFFKTKKFINLPILDMLILISLTLLIMYPITTKTKTINSFKTYSFKKDKKEYVIIIFDVSLSMKDYFEEAKEEALSKIFSNQEKYIMIVAFEKDYAIIQPFTKDITKLTYTIKSLKLNMITHIGGSSLRDTIASIINSFKYLNPTIYIFSDGGDNTSSVTKKELKKIAKEVNVQYIGYGNDKENYFYIKNLNHIEKTTKTPHSFKKIEKHSKTITYEVFDNRFIYLSLILILIKILKVKFENRFNFF